MTGRNQEVLEAIVVTYKLAEQINFWLAVT
jgi:hypothetical protein